MLETITQDGFFMTQIFWWQIGNLLFPYSTNHVLSSYSFQKEKKSAAEKKERATRSKSTSKGGIEEFMDRLWSSLGDLRDPRLDTCDSFGDKLSCKTTVFLLFLFSIVLTVKQHYVGDPIQCWTPDHFKKSHHK